MRYIIKWSERNDGTGNHQNLGVRYIIKYLKNMTRTIGGGNQNGVTTGTHRNEFWAGMKLINRRRKIDFWNLKVIV